MATGQRVEDEVAHLADGPIAGHPSSDPHVFDSLPYPSGPHEQHAVGGGRHRQLETTTLDGLLDPFPPHGQRAPDIPTPEQCQRCSLPDGDLGPTEADGGENRQKETIQAP